MYLLHQLPFSISALFDQHQPAAWSGQSCFPLAASAIHRTLHTPVNFLQVVIVCAPVRRAVLAEVHECGDQHCTATAVGRPGNGGADSQTGHRCVYIIICKLLSDADVLHVAQAARCEAMALSSTVPGNTVHPEAPLPARHDSDGATQSSRLPDALRGQIRSLCRDPDQHERTTGPAADCALRPGTDSVRDGESPAASNATGLPSCVQSL